MGEGLRLRFSLASTEGCSQKVAPEKERSLRMTARAAKRVRKSPVATDLYFELVRQFPLAPIMNDEHLDAALEVIGRLLRETLDTGGQAYLDVLSDLVATYEESQWEETPATPAERLRDLMLDAELTQQAFASETGIGQSTVSAVLNGKRLFTAEQMASLGKHFRVDPGYFLGTP
jgi:antitoxin component HigA of HigAB toxin-antitoxin module